MERLHTRLYEKYRNLKKRRVTEASECSAAVQGDFEKYSAVVESMLEELKSENNKLYEQISSLENSNIEYQQNLLEKQRKVEELSNEVERLRKVTPAENLAPNDEIFALVTPLNISKTQFVDSRERIEATTDSAPCEPSLMETQSYENQLPLSESFDEKMTDSPSDGDYARRVYQMLIKSLVGMEFSVIKLDGDDDAHLSFTHQSSGYSFTLKWLNKGEEEEGEFLYRISSLGTIENVAMDWMKEDMLFGIAMCHSFFGRISRVLGRHF